MNSTTTTYPNIMLDIETMGTAPTSAIVSIAAVRFDIISGDICDTFEWNIDLASCTEKGMTIEPETIMWWLSQSQEAREKLTKHCVNISLALEYLSKFIDTEAKIWSNSPAFDCVILKNAYKVCGMVHPWITFNERDVRTLSSLYPEIKKNTPRTGTAHNALHDCFYQVEYLSKTYKLIRVGDKAMMR